MKNPLKKLKFKRHLVDEILLKQARKEGNIVYGGRVIKRKLGILARPTKDWDFYSKKPKLSSSKAEKKLDKAFKKDVFFKKKGKNPKTWKVKHKGKDLIPRTDDDIGIADYTKTPKPSPETFAFRNVKYRKLPQELKAKQKLLKDKKSEFRKEKDIEDIKRIKKYGRIK